MFAETMALPPEIMEAAKKAAEAKERKKAAARKKGTASPRKSRKK